MTKLVLHVDGTDLSGVPQDILSRFDAVISKSGEVLIAKEEEKPYFAEFVTVGESGIAFQDIIQERLRQKYAKGYDAAHDDAHDAGELAYAAAAMAVPHNAQVDISIANQGKWHSAGWAGLMALLWPRAWDIPESKGTRQDLVAAGAMIVAEIERIDRATEKEKADNHGEVVW